METHAWWCWVLLKRRYIILGLWHNCDGEATFNALMHMMQADTTVSPSLVVVSDRCGVPHDCVLEPSYFMLFYSLSYEFVFRCHERPYIFQDPTHTLKSCYWSTANFWSPSSETTNNWQEHLEPPFHYIWLPSSSVIWIFPWLLLISVKSFLNVITLQDLLISPEILLETPQSRNETVELGFWNKFYRSSRVRAVKNTLHRHFKNIFMVLTFFSL